MSGETMGTMGTTGTMGTDHPLHPFDGIVSAGHGGAVPG